MNQISTATAPTEISNALFDPAQFGHMTDVAKVMVDSEMLPAHLRGIVKQGKLSETFTREKQIATAFLVLNAARLFEAEPFNFAQCTFMVHGKLDFDGKVYAALANKRAGLAGSLSYEYIGEGDQKRCICSGRFANEAETRTFQTPTFVECSKDRTGKVRDAWKNCNPEQQLGYFAARSWVRRHCPEILLGMASDVGEQPDEEPAEDESFVEPQSAGNISVLDAPPNVAVHMEAIRDATSLFELNAIAERIKADENLSNMDKGNIRLAFMERKEAVERACPWHGKVKDAEAILHESDDPKAIEAAWNEIDAIDDLDPMENKRLGDLFSVRMKEFIPQSN